MVEVDIRKRNLTSDHILNNTKMMFVLEKFGPDGLLPVDAAMDVIVDIFLAVNRRFSEEAR